MKQVVSDFIIQKNKLGQAIVPIYLYAIQYDENTNSWLRLCSISTNVVFDGETYYREVIAHDSIKESSSGMLGALTVRVGNGDRNFQYYLQEYNGLKNKKFLIRIVFKDALDNPDCYEEFEYYIKSSSVEADFVTLNLSSAIDVLNLLVPKEVFSPTRCQYADFKDQDCGYSGAEIKCDRSFRRCEQLGNSARFGGFPGVPMPFQGIFK